MKPVVFLLSFACLTQVNQCGLAKEDPKPLADVLAAASKHKVYSPVEFDELKQAETLFVKTLENDVSDEELAGGWSQLGWEFSKLDTAASSEHSVIWILRERDNAIRGRGFFAFRRQSKPLFLQAPHSFYDKHTRRIALNLFQQGLIRAAAWNTVRRSVIDAAHTKDNYINAFTRAVLQTQDRHVILQLHGFSTAKRKTASGRASLVIVSNGTRHPGRIARAVSRELTKSVSDSVKLYPTQVSELGGTKNVQARIVHQHGFDSFIHLEMAGDIRQKLRKSQDTRDRMYRALISSLSTFLDEPT